MDPEKDQKTDDQELDQASNESQKTSKSFFDKLQKPARNLKTYFFVMDRTLCHKRQLKY